jgi:hypothetical protein
MKRYKLPLIITVVVVIALLLVLNQKYGHKLNKPKNIDINAEFTITGILREMDLDPEGKVNRAINDGRFQLTRLNKKDLEKLPYDTTSLFIEVYPESIKGMVGKCVTVVGKLNPSWIAKMDEAYKEDKFLYNALTFDATSVNQNGYDKCDGYLVNNEIPEGSKPVIVTGTIQRLPRVVPDVGPYDYVIMFKDEYISTDNASGEPHKREYMPIEPQSNEIWQKLENKVGTPTALEVYELWGYVESKYLLVIRVMD